MTSADFMRFMIIIMLGIMAFVTFLVTGTILGLMWLDTWSCARCHRYPVGLYILAIMAVLYFISLAYEIADAPFFWSKWIKANWVTIVVVTTGVSASIFVINWWWI
jgi:hypothetical protein